LSAGSRTEASRALGVFGSGWRLPTATAAVAGCLIVGIAIERDWFDKHEGAAAWVQAVGAIAVIIATAWVANANFAEERRRSRDAQRHLWEAAGALSERCIESLTTVLKEVRHIANPSDAFLRAYAPTDLEAPMEGLAAVPLHQLGDVEMVRAVMTMRRVMARVQTELDEFYEHLTTPSVTRGLNVQALGNYATEVFNAHASIMRLTYGHAAEEGLRRFV
jgi:hypothetical protein